MEKEQEYLDECRNTCESCQYEFSVDGEVKDYGKSAGGNPNITRFCKICAGSMCANGATYPNQHHHDGYMLRSLGFIGNAIIQEIRNGFKKLEDDLKEGFN